MSLDSGTKRRLSLGLNEVTSWYTYYTKKKNLSNKEGKQLELDIPTARHLINICDNYQAILVRLGSSNKQLHDAGVS